jgi:hypothetical protein
MRIGKTQAQKESPKKLYLPLVAHESIKTLEGKESWEYCGTH